MTGSRYFTSVRATDRGGVRGRSLHRRAARSRRGAALVATLVIFSGIAGLVYATTVISSVDVRDARGSLDQVKARHAAESGLELGVHYLSDVAKKATFDPLSGLGGLFDEDAKFSPFVGAPLADGNRSVGAVSVTFELESLTDTDCSVRISSTGYVPDSPTNLGPGEQLEAWSAVSAVVTFSLDPSPVFDNGYFINNWGWFYGDTIECYGNARSNGQFDAAGYAPLVGGQPMYEGLERSAGAVDLTGYLDDNGDGLMDGGDGGVFSGWDIVAAEHLRGVGGSASNQHDFQDHVEMPNLSDLSTYEQQALAEDGSIQIGGSKMSNAVFGDEAGETGNLYLVGTAADPIVIDGPIVVQGDVIISGYVQGQGAIYAGGNVYVPDSIEYVDPPTTTRPTDNTEAATEQWMADNWDKDFLGLFSAENIVVGDHTDSTWRHYVSGWMSSSLNQSAEDAGEDGIPNTYAGRDGIVGTADDDVLEGDGVFTTEVYTDADAAMGLIPPGFAVGDVIPGTGEDIDGDGKYDDTTTLADIDLTAPLDTANWGGNMPVAGIADYSTISTLYASTLDAVLYTNHSFCYMVLGSDPARINGALISRNENIVYGTPSVEFNYDCRLLGGSDGMAGWLLPKVLSSPTVDRWTQLDEDPNRYAVQP